MKTIIIIAIGVAAYAVIVALVRGFAALSRRSGAQGAAKASDGGDNTVWWGETGGHDGCGGHDGGGHDGGGFDGGCDGGSH
jgi:uncharacterized membrane protein